MSPEMYVRDIPRSTPFSDQQRKHRVLSVMPMPAHYISHIGVNPVAQDALPNHLKFLASTAYLQQHAYMVIGDPRPDAHTILTPIGWGRAVPVGSGCIPYSDRLVGSIISGKGCSASGYIYPDSLKERDLDYDPITPWGFFGEKDAVFDISASNYLLSMGYRTAIGLGYVTFKDAAIEWLCSHYKNPVQRRYIALMWEVVKENKDTCAYLYRLHGVSSRIGESVPGSCTQAGWASKVHLAEAAFHPRVWESYFLTKAESTHAIQVLEKMANRRKLSSIEAESYLMLLCGLWVRNYEALLQIDTIANPGYSALTLSEYKDIDMAHIRCDYEEMRGKTFSYTDMGYYLNFMYRRFHNYNSYFTAIGAARSSGDNLRAFLLHRINTLSQAWSIPVARLEA